MSAIALLFPGQGSQAVGMGRHLWENHGAAADVFAEAEDLLGWDLRALCADGPAEELTRTDRAQPAIFTCSVATWRVMEEREVGFEVALGHSLGEYSALVAVGHLSFSDALRVVKRRGEAMWACGRRRAGTMAAILGLEDDVVDALCAEAGEAWPANYNSPGQVVISGTPAGVARASALASERGARKVMPLQVSGAFHSPLVAGAAKELAGVLGSVDIGPARRGRFFSTTELRYPAEDELRDVLLRQLTSPVRFTGSILEALEGLDLGVEVGPGGVLAGLVKRVRRDFPVLGTGDAAALNESLERAAGR
ncbi:MAG: ACP S-malonyltransferase [Thermoleophilia bacterium]